MNGMVTPLAWFALPRWERRARLALLRAWQEALDINSYEEKLAGVRWESENNLLLNAQVSDALRSVPWWRR